MLGFLDLGTLKHYYYYKEETLHYYSFVAANSLDTNMLNNLESRFELQESVCLNNLEELKLLLAMHGLSLSKTINRDLIDIEHCWLVEGASKEIAYSEFDDFYQHWLGVSHRESTMDEYGQLIYLNSFMNRFKKAKFKLICQEIKD